VLNSCALLLNYRAIFYLPKTNKKNVPFLIDFILLFQAVLILKLLQKKQKAKLLQQKKSTP
jgi:hypothetical protein